MATCRECRQTYKHTSSCTKARGRTYVDTRDELLSDYDYISLRPSDIGDPSSDSTESPYDGSGSE